MPLAEYETSPREVRNFALLQVALTSGFLLLIYLALGGTRPDLPPWWVLAVLLVAVVVAGFLAERVWLQASPLDPAEDPEELRQQAIGIYAAQTVRKLWICEAAVILAVVASFVGTWGGWPIVVAGVPGLLLLAFETWPSVRNVSMTAAMLETEGASTGLVESFRSWDDRA